MGFRQRRLPWLRVKLVQTLMFNMQASTLMHRERAQAPTYCHKGVYAKGCARRRSRYRNIAEHKEGMGYHMRGSRIDAGTLRRFETTPFKLATHPHAEALHTAISATRRQTATQPQTKTQDT